MTQTWPSRMLAAAVNGVGCEARTLVRSRTYEMTFVGQAGAVLRAEFGDCDVTVGPGATTLRAELPDQGALHGLMQRISGLRLELVDVHVVLPPE